MKQEREMQEIKDYYTGLQRTGALCLLQPVQGAVIRLSVKQSSHVLIANVKVQWGAQNYIQNDYPTTKSTAFKDTLFIRRKKQTT